LQWAQMLVLSSFFIVSILSPGTTAATNNPGRGSCIGKSCPHI
jgi:hypothetical protein